MDDVHRASRGGTACPSSRTARSRCSPRRGRGRSARPGTLGDLLLLQDAAGAERRRARGERSGGRGRRRRARAPRRSSRRSPTRLARCSRTPRFRLGDGRRGAPGAARGAATRSCAARRAPPRLDRHARASTRRRGPRDEPALRARSRGGSTQTRSSPRGAATTSSCSGGCATASPPVFAELPAGACPLFYPLVCEDKAAVAARLARARRRDRGLLARRPPALPARGASRRCRRSAAACSSCPSTRTSQPDDMAYVARAVREALE